MLRDWFHREPDISPADIECFWTAASRLRFVHGKQFLDYVEEIVVLRSGA